MKRFAALLLLLAGLAGCSSDAQTLGRARSAEYTLGVLLKGMESSHWMDVRTGINDAARELGVNIVLLYPAQEDAVNEQLQMYDDLVACAPDAILFAPCDSSNCAPRAALAQQNGIPLYCIDTAATDIELPYIGADNERIGRMAATRLAGLAEKRGKLAVIAGVSTQSSHSGRIAGFESALAGYPEITLAGVYRGDSDFRQSMACMEQIMREHPDVKGVFCTSATMALGAMEQLSVGGYEKKPAIVAVDTQDDTLAALQAGTLAGLVTQDGYEAGYEAVKYAVARLRGEAVQESIYIETELLTPETAEAFIKVRRQQRGDRT